MSTDYYCDLATDVGTEEVASRLMTELGGTIEVRGNLLQVVTAVVCGVIMTEIDPVAREWFLEDWGIDSKISISFSLDRSAPDQEYYAGRRDFTIASVRLAEDLDADALFRHESGRVMMRRQNGSLTLYDWWPDWTDPKTIAALPSGYTLVSDGERTNDEPTSE